MSSLGLRFGRPYGLQCLTETLHCAAPVGRVDKRCAKGHGRLRRVVLLEQEIAELFTSGDDRPRGGGRLLHRILFVRGLAHEGFGFLWPGVCLGRPRCDFLLQDVHLRGPVIVADATQFVFVFLKRLLVSVLTSAGC